MPVSFRLSDSGELTLNQSDLENFEFVEVESSNISTDFQTQVDSGATHSAISPAVVVELGKHKHSFFEVQELSTVSSLSSIRFSDINRRHRRSSNYFNILRIASSNEN